MYFVCKYRIMLSNRVVIESVDIFLQTLLLEDMLKLPQSLCVWLTL